jgi:Protein kinase domain
MGVSLRMRSGNIVDGWSLQEPLGRGGNAEVWKATKSGATVALKILDRKSPESEPYKRFRDEIEIHTRLSHRTGVLPVVAYSLPPRPSSRAPAWIAMPVADGMRSALGDDPSLRTVIGAVQEQADTLASLHEEGIFHRDIKPDNLYCYNGRWAVGDFGLASFPGKEAVTVPGKRLGPQYFHAPEMLTDPVRAGGGPADVYSLAKTLWVLATGQQYPLPGEQRLGNTPVSLARWVVDRGAHALDVLLDRSTRISPEERPTMREFADQLRAWVTPPSPGEPSDLSDLAVDFKAIVFPQEQREATLERHITAIEDLKRQILANLQGLYRTLSTSGLQTRFGIGWTWWADFFPQRGLSFRTDSSTCGMTNVITGKPPVYMASGIVFRTTEDGRIELGGGHGVLRENGSRHEVVWSTDSIVTLLESPQQEEVVARISNSLIESSRQAVVELKKRMVSSI